MHCAQCQQVNPVGAKFCNECGAPLPRPCQACGQVNPPQAKFCNECGTSLSGDVTGTGPARPASPPAPGLASHAATPQAYTPSHLVEKIRTAKSALEGERKQVTVLFADLKGSMELLGERDPEEARQLLDPVLERLMAAVHRYEGTVNQIMGDGIMALFGAPVAHEDHAVRACYAALAMQEAIRRYSAEVRRTHGVEVQIRVGLNSGEVVVRAIGNDLHMDYSAIGQTTHLAARIDRLAAGGETAPPDRRGDWHGGALTLLQAIARVPEDALHRGLARLQAAEFLYETRLFPEPAYTFKHALTHEVAYGSLLQERRRVLHAGIVEASEALTPEREIEVASGVKGLPAGRQGPDQVERLAYHAVRGEVWDKAVNYCRQAGARALARAAFREAVASFEQALQALAAPARDSAEPEAGHRSPLRCGWLSCAWGALAVPRHAAGGRVPGQGGRRSGPARTGAGPDGHYTQDQRATYDGASTAGQQALELASRSATAPCRSAPASPWGGSTRMATSAGRWSCCGGTWRRRTLGVGSPVDSRAGTRVPGVAGAGAWRARGVCGGPALWRGGAPPRRAGRPRGHTDHCPRLPRPPVPRARGPGARHPAAGAGSRPLSCLRQPVHLLRTIVADLGYAYALAGRLAEGVRCWRRGAAKETRTGGASQVRPAGSHG